MRLTTFICLFGVLSTGIVQSEEIADGFYNSYNSIHSTRRYRRHHHRPSRVVRHTRSESIDTRMVVTEWPYVEVHVLYPYVTGSSILDLARTTYPYDRSPGCVAPRLEVLRLVSVVQ